VRTSPPLSALLGAALLALGAPAAASAATSSIATPSDGTPLAYDTATPASIPVVSGTASGTAAVDLRCARYWNGTWSYSPVLTGGANVAVSGGSFSAANVAAPISQGVCRLAAVPAGTMPTDATPFTGPWLRLLRLDTTSTYNRDQNGGADQGKEYDFGGDMTGLAADTFLTAASSAGVDGTLLIAPATGEQGEVFGTADAINELDPATGPDPTSTATGVTVDGTNTYLGWSWNDQVTPSMKFVFNSYTPFPAVTGTPSIGADGSLVVTEHDVMVTCFGSDPNYYKPAGFTCQGLTDAGVQLDLITTMSPSGTVITRRWQLSSTDGMAHQVHLVIAHRAYNNGHGHPRTWRLPGQTTYAAHVNGDQPAAPAQAPWTVRFHSEGAADGDLAEGVGAVTSSVAPTGLRFIGTNSLAVTYTLNVPATGAVELRDTLMSEATQAALEADIAAAERTTSGGGPGGGGGGTGGGGGSGTTGTPVPQPGPVGGSTPQAPRLTRIGTATLKGTRLTSGYKLACPGTGSACTATLSILPKATASKRRPKALVTARVTVKAGKITALVIKVPARRRTALRRSGLTLRAVIGRTPLKAVTVTRSLRIRTAAHR
jgi:hypothetical protein